MRKCIFLLSIAFLLCGCSKSIEEKAKDLVTDNLSESVTNKKSLQIISISVDSCFYDIMAVDKLLKEYHESNFEWDRLKSNADFARERLDVAKENPKTLFDVIRLQRRYDEYNKELKALFAYEDQVIFPKKNEILTHLRPEGTKEFKCYKVSVKYKAEASKGNLKEHTVTYYVKADITGIIKALDLENDTCRHYKQKLRFEEDSIPKML